MRQVLVLVAALVSGCVFNNMSAEETLRDSVVGLNDECRWNRFDLAQQRVEARYRNQFRMTHHSWHRDFQIADSEIMGVEVGEGRERATSLVQVRWYDHSTMILHDTTVKQTWKRGVNGYFLVEEEVADGNERLLEIPESLLPDEDEEDSEEDEEEATASASTSDSEEA